MRHLVVMAAAILTMAAAPPPAATPTDAEIVSIVSRVAIVVADHERSKRFYSYALGYRIGFDGEIGNRAAVRQQLGLTGKQTARFAVLSNDQVIGGQRRDAAMIGLLSIGDPAPPVMRRPAGADLAIGEAMLAVRTTDIARVRARLRELGARVLVEPMRSPDGRETELVVHDPDGIRIHVVERADAP